MNGLHQIENSSVAIAFAHILNAKNRNIVINKINSSIKNTYWPGRLEICNYKSKKIILDGSHNIDGAKKLNEFLKLRKLKPVVIFGMLNNKKIEYFLNIIKRQIKEVLAIKIPNEKNAFESSHIKKICIYESINCKEVRNVRDALQNIISSKEKVFLITGSLYLVGKIRKVFI